MNIEESTGILSDERVATPSATSTLLASTSTHFFLALSFVVRGRWAVIPFRKVSARVTGRPGTEKAY
jgi:hypothetical protein